MHLLIGNCNKPNSRVRISAMSNSARPTSDATAIPGGASAIRAALLACSLLLAGVAANRAEATPTLVAGNQVSLVGIEGASPNPNPGAEFPAVLTVGPAGSDGLFP